MGRSEKTRAGNAVWRFLLLHLLGNGSFNLWLFGLAAGSSTHYKNSALRLEKHLAEKS